MAGLSRLKNRGIAKLLGKLPFLERFFTALYKPSETEGIPWTPVGKPLHRSTVAIVTTAGVHRKDQEPFNMADEEGDPTFRIIHAEKPAADLMITHDYYDHTDAERDINIVLPVERLRELESEGIIGRCASRHYSFMGHILGDHIATLTGKTAPEVARLIRADGVDIVVLTPG